MKILAIKPIDTGVYKDIFEVFCEGLEKYHGHEVIRVPYIYAQNKIYAWKEFDQQKLEGADMVWSPFEPLLPVAFNLKKEYDVPVVGHFEVIPKDINLYTVEQYWTNHIYEYPLYKAAKYVDYKYFGDLYMKCDAKTYLDEYTMFLIERLVGLRIDRKKTFIQPYPFDNEMMGKFRDENIKEKRQIISTFRLVDYKRAQHVIKALSLMDNPPKYVIVGKGVYKDKIVNIANELNVEVEFVGEVSDELKAKHIQESMLSVYPWAWIPIAESSFFKKPAIVYDVPDTHNKMREMPIYTRNNDIKELSNIIEHYVNNDKERLDAGKKAFKELSEGRTDILFQKEACNVLNNIFEEAKK